MAKNKRYSDLYILLKNINKYKLGKEEQQNTQNYIFNIYYIFYKMRKEEQQNIQNYIFYNKKKKDKTNENKKGEKKKICHLQYQHKCVAL